jgi:hypothetical protein
MCQHPFYLAFRISSVGTVPSVLFILIFSLKKDMLSAFAFVYILILIRWHFPANLSAGNCVSSANIYQQIYSNLLSALCNFPIEILQRLPSFPTPYRVMKYTVSRSFFNS